MRIASVLAGLGSMLAMAEASALDCEALKTTRVPFELEFRQQRLAKDGSPQRMAPLRAQIFRRSPEETVHYAITGPGAVVTRTRLKHDLFPLDVREPDGAIRHWTYSIDTDTDPLIARQPLSYHGERRDEGGRIDSSVDVTLAFTGSASLTVEGCRFDLAKVVLALAGTSSGKPLRYTAEMWRSPELHASLQTRIETDDYTLTYTATTIRLEFDRVDRNR
jgi:hypothetical protein